MTRRNRLFVLLACASVMAGAESAPTVKELIHKLQSGDIDQRERAAEALGAMGPAAKEAIKPLLAALDDELPYLRIRSAEALVKIGPEALPALIQATQNVNGEVRAIAVAGVGKYGQNDEAAVTALTHALHDKELQVRGAAALALGNLGPSAQSAIPALEQAAQDPNPSVAEDAARALKLVTGTPAEKPKEPSAENTTAPAPPPAAPVTAHPKAAKKPSAPARPKPAVKTVKKTKAPPPPTPEALLAQLQAEVPIVSSATEQAIIQRSSETTPLLIQGLPQGGTTYTDTYIDLLEKIGTDDARKAVTAWRKGQQGKKMSALIKDLRQEGKASDQAADTLVTIGTASVSAVMPVLSDPRPPARRAAAKVLNRLGAGAAPATPALITALDDSDSEVRAQSAEALGKIGSPPAQQALRFFPIKDKFLRFLALFKH